MVVGPEDASTFRAYWTKEALPFAGLSDPKHTVAEMYGQEIKLLKFGRMPALLIVDKAGNIRYMHYADSMSDIPPNAEVLAKLDRISAGEQG